MAQTQHDHQSRANTTRSDLSISRGDLYNILANQRRRYAIHYLQYTNDTVELAQLAEQIGAWEQDTSTANLPGNKRKTVYTALQQRHLPQMDNAGIIEFDGRAGTIKPTPSLDKIDIYTEIVGEDDFQWSQYYLALSAIMTTLFSAGIGGVYPLSLVPNVAWGACIIIAFSISAVCHIIVNRGMKLGRDEKPPELSQS